MEKVKVEYSMSIVAFLDVFGWRSLIERSLFDDHLRSAMAIALQEVSLQRDFVPGVFDMAQVEGNPLPVISQFSDSIIVSVNITREEQFSFETFYDRVDLLCKAMLMQGFFMRGGIAMGALFHRGSVAFGPALVEAARLEAIAVYPRILVDGGFGEDPEQLFIRFDAEPFNLTASQVAETQ